MEEKDYSNKIEKLNSEISELEKSKQQYENVNKQINEALPQLTKMKQEETELFETIKKNYSSQALNSEIKKYEGQLGGVDKAIVELRDKALVESNKELSKINSQLESKKAEVQRLRTEEENNGGKN